MKRPLCVIGFSLMLFTWLAFFFSAGQALLLSLAGAATGLLLALLHRLYGRRELRIACAVCFTAGVALALHASYEARYLEPFYRAEGETVWVEGLITDAYLGARSVRYTLSASFPGREDLPASTLTLRTHGEMDHLAGEIVRFQAVLRPAEQPERGLRHGRDSFLEATLEGKAARLQTGYRLQRGLFALRARMRDNLYATLRPDSADVVSAMVLGMKDNIDSDLYSSVSRSGTVHLLSVSGLHLSILTGVVLRLMERLGASRRLRSLAAILVALSFAVLVGFSPSILRAFLMTAIALGAGLGSRRSDSLSSLGCAVLVIALAWPDWLLGRGIWLSAGSTLGILLFADPLGQSLEERLSNGSPVRDHFVRFMAGGLSVGIAAYGVTLPLLVGFYGWISLVSPLANLLVTPFVPVVIIGGILCALVGGGTLIIRFIGALTDLCTALLLQLSEIMAGFPFATVSLDQAWMLLWLALLAVVGGILLRYRGRRMLASYGAALLVLSFCAGNLSHSLNSRNTIELVTIADCDAALLLRGNEAVILGTPAYYETGRLLRYLEYRGVSAIRAIVAADCGEQIGSGLIQLCSRYPVDMILGPNDAYVLGQLATALPDVSVYSGGYATAGLLGGAAVSITVPESAISVQVGRNTVIKSSQDYAIMKDRPVEAPITLYPDGAAVYTGATGYEPTPLGTMLYGETRYRLR